MVKKWKPKWVFLNFPFPTEIASYYAMMIIEMMIVMMMVTMMMMPMMVMTMTMIRVPGQRGQQSRAP